MCEKTFLKNTYIYIGFLKIVPFCELRVLLGKMALQFSVQAKRLTRSVAYWSEDLSGAF